MKIFYFFTRSDLMININFVSIMQRSYSDSDYQTWSITRKTGLTGENSEFQLSSFTKVEFMGIQRC